MMELCLKIVWSTVLKKRIHEILILNVKMFFIEKSENLHDFIAFQFSF